MSRQPLKREHGSMRGVRQHWTRHEPLCEECRPIYKAWRAVGDGYATKANGYWRKGENVGRPPGTGRPKNEPRCGKPMKVKPMKDGTTDDNPVCARPYEHSGACKSTLAYQKQAERGKEWRRNAA